jgi:hypothetical protein
MIDWTPQQGEYVLVKGPRSALFAAEVRRVDAGVGWVTVRVKGTGRSRRARIEWCQQHPLSTQRNVPEES